MSDSVALSLQVSVRVLRAAQILPFNNPTLKVRCCTVEEALHGPRRVRNSQPNVLKILGSVRCLPTARIRCPPKASSTVPKRALCYGESTIASRRASCKIKRQGDSTIYLFRR